MYVIFISESFQYTCISQLYECVVYLRVEECSKLTSNVFVYINQLILYTARIPLALM